MVMGVSVLGEGTKYKLLFSKGIRAIRVYCQQELSSGIRPLVFWKYIARRSAFIMKARKVEF
jgi:hypothetical protein